MPSYNIYRYRIIKKKMSEKQIVNFHAGGRCVPDKPSPVQTDGAFVTADVVNSVHLPSSVIHPSSLSIMSGKNFHGLVTVEKFSLICIAKHANSNSTNEWHDMRTSKLINYKKFYL